MRKLKVLIGIACFVFASLAGAQTLQEGRDYSVLAAPQPTEAAGKVEVIEFFSYMCPHCAHFDPSLSKWLKTLPKDVVFKRVPVIFRPQWEPTARLYYTLETLGALDKLHGAAFDAIHAENLNMASDAVVIEWAVRKGIERKAFTDVYGSFAVQSKVTRAKQASGAYGVPGVPALVVAGKYRTADNAPSHEELLGVVDALIAKARKEQKR